MQAKEPLLSWGGGWGGVGGGLGALSGRSPRDFSKRGPVSAAAPSNAGSRNFAAVNGAAPRPPLRAHRALGTFEVENVRDPPAGRELGDAKREREVFSLTKQFTTSQALSTVHARMKICVIAVRPLEGMSPRPPLPHKDRTFSHCSQGRAFTVLGVLPRGCAHATHPKSRDLGDHDICLTSLQDLPSQIEVSDKSSETLRPPKLSFFVSLLHAIMFQVQNGHVRALHLLAPIPELSWLRDEIPP